MLPRATPTLDPHAPCAQLSSVEAISTRVQRRAFRQSAGPPLRCARRAHSRSVLVVSAAPPFNVVLTGSTKGIGRALAEKFLEAGDSVCVSSRTESRVSETVKQLQAVAKRTGGTVTGVAANVAKPADVCKLAGFAQQNFGSIDIWINNAGSNAYSYVPLAENDVNDLISIVETNMLGVMLGCREAIQVMRNQSIGGHIFNMDGAGADGNATPRFAAYGSTKRGLAQFQKSLAAELKQLKLDKKVVVHNLSPGMVTTELLMAGANSSKVASFFINCLAEEPADVATALVPQIRKVVQEGSSRGSYIRQLTKPRAYSQIIQRLLTGARKGRFVPEN